jgi:hypothetical protein
MFLKEIFSICKGNQDSGIQIMHTSILDMSRICQIEFIKKFFEKVNHAAIQNFTFDMELVQIVA